MSKILGKVKCAYTVWNNPEDPDCAYELMDWILDRLDVIRSHLPALYQCIYHRLDFSFPAMGVSTALEEIKSILTTTSDDADNWSGSDLNAMGAAADLADLIVMHDIDS